MSRRRRIWSRRRRPPGLPGGLAPAVAAVGIGVGLAACSSGGGSPPSSRAATTSTAPVTSSSAPTTPAPTTTAPTTSSSPPSTTSTLVPVNGNLSSCTTADLSLSIGGPPLGSAGAIDEALVMTNTGRLPCYLYGYPGVSAVTGPAGRPVGGAAERATWLGPPTVVTLAPGGKASADVHVVDALNYPASTCRPTKAAGLLVYVPGETHPAFVATPTLVCAAGVPGGLAVGPVVAGASLPAAG